MKIGKREKILVSASCGVLIGAWLMVAPSSTPTKAPPPPKGAVIASAEKMAATLATLNTVPTLTKSDPFMPISKTATPSQSAPTAPSFALQGIFSDGQGRAAILNGQIVYEGAEIVPGVQLTQVLREEVVIKRGEEELHIGFTKP